MTLLLHSDFYPRPGFGTTGRPIAVLANQYVQRHFPRLIQGTQIFYLLLHQVPSPLQGTRQDHHALRRRDQPRRQGSEPEEARRTDEAMLGHVSSDAYMYLHKSFTY